MQSHMLVFTQEMFTRLHHDLLKEAPLETAAFLLAHPVKTPLGAWRLVAYEIIPVEPNEYTDRTPVSIELPPTKIASILQRARVERASIIQVHSHPFAEKVEPSWVDLQGEARLLPTFFRRVPDVPHARLILGPKTLNAALFEAQTEEQPLSVYAVSANLETFTPENSKSQSDDSLFDRQIRAFGGDGQVKLKNMTVGIVGLGGTGSLVAQQLAHLGVGHFLLIDPDTIETTNLNRVVGARYDDVGRPKVTVAATMLESINPKAKSLALQEDIRDTQTVRSLLDADFFFCCTDSHGSRAVLTQFAYQYLVPGIDMGVAIYISESSVSRISGRVQMLAPGLPCLICGNVLDAEMVRRDLLTDEARKADSYIIGVDAPQPAVISINSTVASLAVTMFLSAITGIPATARHYQIRLEQGIIRPIGGTPQNNCPICSVRGVLFKGDAWPPPGRGLANGNG